MPFCSATCFLCLKEDGFTPVDESVASQVKYLFPEITTLKLAIPLRICTSCGNKLQAFSEFKHVCVESSQRYEENVKDFKNQCAGPNTQLQTNCASANDHVKPETCEQDTIEKDAASFQIFVKEEPLEKTANDIEYYNSILQTITKREYTGDNFEGYSDSDMIVKTTDDNVVCNNQTNVDIKIEKTENDKITEEINKNEIYDKIKLTRENLLKPSLHKDMKRIAIKEQNIEASKIDDNQICIVINDDNKKLTKSKNKTSKVQSCSKGNTTLDDIIIIDDNDNDETAESKQEEEEEEDILMDDKPTYVIIDDEPTVGNNDEKMDELTMVVYICFACKKIFGSETYLDNHMESCTCLKKQFKCSACFEEFNLKKNWSKHVDRCIYMEKTVKCDMCDSKFNTEHAMARHRERHFENQQCNVCKKTFPDSVALKKHVTSHYVCSICGKRFYITGSLNRHMKNHHRQEHDCYVCHVCDKKFSEKRYLKAHMAYHTNDEIFKLTKEIGGTSTTNS